MSHRHYSADNTDHQHEGGFVTESISLVPRPETILEERVVDSHGLPSRMIVDGRPHILTI
jgi:hypothetical protein